MSITFSLLLSLTMFIIIKEENSAVCTICFQRLGTLSRPCEGLHHQGQCYFHRGCQGKIGNRLSLCLSQDLTRVCSFLGTSKKSIRISIKVMNLVLFLESTLCMNYGLFSFQSYL